MLVESQGPTWLYATASEHAVFYQFNFDYAVNIFAGLLQTESPYFQPSPRPPAPFDLAVGIFDSDPAYACGDDFDGCDSSWAIILTSCSDIYVAAAGVYSWFSDYTQQCSMSPSLPGLLVL